MVTEKKSVIHSMIPFIEHSQNGKITQTRDCLGVKNKQDVSDYKGVPQGSFR